ncbi:MAG: hypothetical protein ACM3SR_02630 [Ignavibacteriales bacterium]
MDGKIYAIGGVGIDGENASANEVCDPRATVEKRAPIPTVRDYFAIGVFHERNLRNRRKTLRKS